MVQHAWVFSVGKAMRELNFRESLSLEEGITGTIAWYRKEGWI